MAKASDPRICTTSGPPEILEGPAPGPIDEVSGQHKNYWVLCKAERDKGFVRPVRQTYTHVGPSGPRYPTRELTSHEKELWNDAGFVCFEPYPDETDGSATGRFWTREELDAVGKGCQGATSMGTALAETWARDPRFYGATFCFHCRKHLPVREFIWDDGSRLGS